MNSPDLGDGLSLDRRQFLARCGVLGAGLAFGGPLSAAARAADPPAELVKVAAALMRQLAYDTFAGLVAFAVPGNDVYSKAQGVTSPTPGAVDARAHELIMESADYFLPLADNYAQAMAAAFKNGVSDSPIPAEFLAQLGFQLEQGAVTLDQALTELLGNDGAVPLSLLFALFMNFEATAVNPASLFGPFPTSPFANLKLADKAKVFERIERADTDLIAQLDDHLPEPLRSEISGVLKFVGGTLLEFAGYTPWTEYGTFDAEQRIATSRPVGWELSNYLPGRTTPVDGTDELLGYWKKHKKAAGRAPKYRPKRKRRPAKRRRRKNRA
ncbi:MAG TPA: twin-arginine translocation signal domain-containing protein [Solirubrobacteraceae bacterium]